MSGVQRQALVHYTETTGADFVNEGLRGNRGLSIGYLQMIKSLDGVFNNAPKLAAPVTLYRGVHTFSEATDITKPFISTSYMKSVAISFALKPGSSLLQIEVAAGTPVLSMESISTYPIEREVLLPRSGRVTLVSRTRDEVSGLPLIKLRYEYGTGKPSGTFDEKTVEFSSWYTVQLWLSLAIWIEGTRMVIRAAKDVPDRPTKEGGSRSTRGQRRGSSQSRRMRSKMRSRMRSRRV